MNLLHGMIFGIKQVHASIPASYQCTGAVICRPWFKIAMFYPSASIQVDRKQIGSVFVQINPISYNENRPVSLRAQKDILAAVLMAADQLVLCLLMGIIGERSSRMKAFCIVFPVIKISAVTDHIPAVIFRAGRIQYNILCLQCFTSVIQHRCGKSGHPVFFGINAINAVGNLRYCKNTFRISCSIPFLPELMIQPAVKNDLCSLHFVQILIQNSAPNRPVTGKNTVCAVIQEAVPQRTFGQGVPIILIIFRFRAHRGLNIVVHGAKDITGYILQSSKGIVIGRSSHRFRQLFQKCDGKANIQSLPAADKGRSAMTVQKPNHLVIGLGITYRKI